MSPEKIQEPDPVSSEQQPKLSRREFLKGAAVLAGAMVVPETLRAVSEAKTETDLAHENAPLPEYFEGIEDLHQKAITEPNEFFGIYREQEGAGAWAINEQQETSGIFDLEKAKEFLGNNPVHTCVVHTHPEQQVGKGWSPPSLLDIQGVVAVKHAFEGKNIHTQHQVVDATGVWTFELDPTSTFAVAMRYLHVKTPDVANALTKDAATKQFAKDGEDPRIIGADMLNNLDKFKFSTRRKMEKFGALAETLLGDFNLEDFDREIILTTRTGKETQEEKFKALVDHYKKLGVTVSYEPFSGKTNDTTTP